MPVLTKFQDFTPAVDKQRVLNHAWLAQGVGTTDFYFLQVDPATGALPFTTVAANLTPVNNIYYAYGSGAVTTAAYTQILAATSGEVTTLWIQDTSGSMLILATGAAASEVPLFYIQAGGFGFQLEVTIAAGTRLSLKALDTNATTGAFLATLLA